MGAWTGSAVLYENNYDGYLPGPLGPCPYRKSLMAKTASFNQCMQDWDERCACNELDCPICPNMKAYHFMQNNQPRKIKFQGELEEEESPDISSDEETMVHESDHYEKEFTPILDDPTVKAAKALIKEVKDRKKK